MSVAADTLRLMSSGGWGSTVGDETGVSLLPLTPVFDKAQHDVYLRHLRHALIAKGDHGAIHNIALMGGYGVGKSSILQALSKEKRFKHTAVTVSLPTLGEAAGQDDPASAVKPKIMNVTNRIQKEIVKQLIYRESPHRVPRSRYRRLTGFKWLNGLGLSFLIAVPLLLALYLTHASDRLVHQIGHGLWWHALAYAFLFLLLTMVTTGLQHRLFHNRIRVQQVSAATATVTLTDKSESYFDEYLDEIIYFFEVTKVDTLIFEDIDRFDDPHIFETLRELNTILNNCKQLRGRSIRFIYAIKDSIFEQLLVAAAEQAELMDAAEAEIVRANRTKFFDLVIPVVPFITHRSARDLMAGVVDEADLPVSRELIDLAAKHVADMRLIKNIRNEFVVFREKLLQGDGVPGLGADQLFAMILYKNVHLSDFELIRTGKSRLDTLYRDSRALVSENIGVLNDQAREQSQIIAEPEPLRQRCIRLGERLETYISQVVRHRLSQAGQINLQLSGRVWSMVEFRTADFWRSFLKPGAVLEARMAYPYQNEVFTFDVASIGGALGEALALDRWTERDREDARLTLARVEADKMLLAHADMKELFDRPDFTLTVDAAQLSFEEIARRTLGSKLAVDLVAKGYIDQNFTLYVSQYHGVRVSTRAMNFILHVMQPNIMDPYFRFDSSADIRAVLDEYGPDVLTGRCAYNIAILDYLLAQQNEGAADAIIRRLPAWGEHEREFVRIYVASGTHVTGLIRRLSAFWPRTLPLAVTDLEVDEDQRTLLVNAALLGIEPGKVITPDEPVKEFIERRYQDLQVFTDEAESSAAGDVAQLLERLSVKLGSIQPLNAELRVDVIERRLYVFSKDNLVQAPDRDDLALDCIEAVNGDVYAYVLDNLEEYVAIVLREPIPRTIDAPERFVAILEDVVECCPSAVPAMVAHANPNCRVNDLDDISPAAWPDLACGRRFPLTCANVSRYVDQFGVDECLAVPLLADPSITGSKQSPGPERSALAVAILNARRHLADPAVRVQIVTSLELDYCIDVTKVFQENGELIGLLVARGLIQDDVAAYEAIASLEWETKEFLISNSENFPQYVTSGLLSADDLRQLFDSKRISDVVKRSVLSRIGSLASKEDRRAPQAAADYAIRDQMPLAMDTLQLLAEARVTSATIVLLLQPALLEASPDTLARILVAMGRQYELLASRGYRPATLPNDLAHRALAERLKEIGIVSSVVPGREGRTIRVYMKRP
jgi:hypothetical protein